MAVDKGQKCVSKAEHRELREFCERLVKSQKQEIEEMQGWLKDWYQTSHEPKPLSMKQPKEGAQ